jgi:hypothetical protein
MINKEARLYYIFFVLALLMLSTVAYSNCFLEREALAQENNFLTYENSALGIKMLYPHDWHRTDFATGTGGNGTIAEFLGPEPPAAYVNIFVYHSSGSFSLPALINNTLSEIEAVHMNPTTTLHLKNGTTAYQTSYQISTIHNTFEKMQTFIMKNGLIYVITFTATPDKYSLNLPTLTRMINSLTISNPISR